MYRSGDNSKTRIRGKVFFTQVIKCWWKETQSMDRWVCFKLCRQGEEFWFQRKKDKWIAASEGDKYKTLRLSIFAGQDQSVLKTCMLVTVKFSIQQVCQLIYTVFDRCKYLYTDEYSIAVLTVLSDVNFYTFMYVFYGYSCVISANYNSKYIVALPIERYNRICRQNVSRNLWNGL